MCLMPNIAPVGDIRWIFNSEASQRLRRFRPTTGIPVFGETCGGIRYAGSALRELIYSCGLPNFPVCNCNPFCRRVHSERFRVLVADLQLTVDPHDINVTAFEYSNLVTLEVKFLPCISQ